MKNVLRITALAIVCAFAGSTHAAPQPSDVTDFSAAKRGQAYAAKKAACKREAKKKNFGIHFVKATA